MLVAHDARGEVASVAYGNIETIDERGGSLGCMTVESDPGNFPALLQSGISPTGQQGMVFGAPVVRALDGYDLRYDICADLDFWVRAHAQGFRFRYYPQEVGRFRIRPGQISGDVSLLRTQVAENHPRTLFLARVGCREAIRSLAVPVAQPAALPWPAACRGFRQQSGGAANRRKEPPCRQMTPTLPDGFELVVLSDFAYAGCALAAII